MIRDEMLERMSAAEFYGWQHYFSGAKRGSIETRQPQSPQEMLGVLSKAAGGIKRKKRG